MTTNDRTRAIAWFEKQSKCLAMPGAAKMFGLAAEALNALDVENEPLTIEQLWNMDGEPVWVVCGIYADWRIPEFIDEGAYKGFIKFSDRSAEPISDYGKRWLAYRRPPQKG